MNRDLIGWLRTLGLPNGHWALFGSGPLLLRDWIDHVNDLDVVTRGPAWEMALGLGELVSLDDGNSIVDVGNGITIGRTWAYGEVDIGFLIDTAETIDGVPCVTIEHIVEYKRIADRPRDREHLRIIKNHT